MSRYKQRTEGEWVHWSRKYRGQLSGTTGMEYVRAKTASHARKQFKSDYPLRDVVYVGSKPILKGAEPDGYEEE